MNLQKMMKQAQEMQNKVAQMQARVEAMEAEGSAGGMVTIRLNGKNQMLSIQINEEMLKAEEKETLEDLIIAAYHSAREKLDDASSEETKKISSGLNLPPGMKLPF